MQGENKMATNSNNHGGNGQRPAGSGRRPSGNGQRPAGQRPSGSRPAGSSYGQKRESAKQRAAKKRRKVIIFGIEIVVILVMVAVLYLVMTHTNNEGPKFTVLETEELRIPEEVQQDETMKGYMNIALFGVDATKESQLYKGSRSDSVMIASVNMDTGDIKLVSIYRDTYLNIGTDSYQKANAAYSYGGAEQAVKMLNMNLDMDITNFVTVGYKGLSEVIDGLGGIYIDVDSEEIKHINNYQIGIAEVLKCDYTPVTETGTQLLNGLQATAYCRIRYVGNDFARTQRQRTVIEKVAKKAMTLNPATLNNIANAVFPKIATSLDLSEIIELLGGITGYTIGETASFPFDGSVQTGRVRKMSVVIPQDLEYNVKLLHQMFFDEQDYEPSSTVKTCSSKIASDTGVYYSGQ